MIYYCFQCCIFYANELLNNINKTDDLHNKCPLCDGKVTIKIFISEIVIKDEKINIYSLFENEKGENKVMEEKIPCTLISSGYCKYPHKFEKSVKIKK